ncbi:ATP synthase F0 subunit C [Caviibacter abscessus]|uniref:ATP synthase F0 subunit C n=1 Tax=Caviibacter abscessus TaxID=1766719 RepID=UPI000832A21D|nr:ATP synthase F0 subunit C [Caviibacter abscessus]
MIDGNIIKAAALLGAGIAACGGIGTGIGQGLASAAAVEAVSRQPEAKSSIMTTLFIGCALTETSAIFALLIALLLLLLKG